LLKTNKLFSLSSPEIINFPKIQDPRGNLTFIQYPDQIPFEIQRILWTYDVPGGEQIGGHAYRDQEEVIIALSGSFDVVVTEPSGKSNRFFLNKSFYGLYLPFKTWSHIENFSTNAVALHISNKLLSIEDYILNFEDFKNMVNE
jgi:hypothetical protein